MKTSAEAIGNTAREKPLRGAACPDLEEGIAAKAAAAKVIKGVAVEQPALPAAAAADPSRRRTRMHAEADTALGQHGIGPSAGRRVPSQNRSTDARWLLLAPVRESSPR